MSCRIDSAFVPMLVHVHCLVILDTEAQPPCFVGVTISGEMHPTMSLKRTAFPLWSAAASTWEKAEAQLREDLKSPAFAWAQPYLPK